MDSYAYARFTSGQSHDRMAERTNRVKNKAPAEIQITAEQLLREASERSDVPFKVIKQRGIDIESIQGSADQLHAKRKAFEDALRRNRGSIGTWLKYAAFEERLNERPRARSIYERVLEVDYRNPVIWLKYAEMEMKAGNIQHTRNIWNRAVSLLPRIDQFWYKWAYFEEKLGNIEGARAIFERWIEGWRPPVSAFQSFIKLEMRYKETERVRAIYRRMIEQFSTDSEVWIDAAKWEESLGAYENARAHYETAVETLGFKAAPKLFTSFAKFEIRRENYGKARQVFQRALKTLPADISTPLFIRYTQFEKQFGSPEHAEKIVLEGRVKVYEEELAKNTYAYDTWFERIWLEQELASMNAFDDDSEEINPLAQLLPHNNASIETLFKRATSHIPLSLEKEYWRRYVYLWIYYAVWKELTQKSPISEVIDVLERAINCIPADAGWSFSKLWILLAKALIRNDNLARARKVLGMAIGKNPKRSLFRYYIAMECKLKDFDRARKLYERWIMWRPDAEEPWCAWSALETSLGDHERAKALLIIAIDSGLLLFSELVKLIKDPLEVKDWIEKWISATPDDPTPWIELCELDPYQWERALLHFEELEGSDLSALARIIDGYIASEEAAQRPTDWLISRRPIFDEQEGVWLRPSDGAEAHGDGLGSLQEPQYAESNAAIRLLEMARQWKKGEMLFPSNEVDDDGTVETTKQGYSSITPYSDDSYKDNHEDLDY